MTLENLLAVFGIVALSVALLYYALGNVEASAIVRDFALFVWISAWGLRLEAGRRG